MARPAKDIQHQKDKPKGKSSSKTATATAAAPNSSSTAFTKKRIETAKPNSKAPMLASDFDESKFLKGLDLEMGSEEVLTISDVTAEVIGDEKKTKPVLSFKEIDKGLVLNKTNMTPLVKTHGNDMSRWIGHDVVLYPAMVQFKNKMVQAVRLRIPGPKEVRGSSSRRKG